MCKAGKVEEEDSSVRLKRYLSKQSEKQSHQEATRDSFLGKAFSYFSCVRCAYEEAVQQIKIISWQLFTYFIFVRNLIRRFGAV